MAADDGGGANRSLQETPTWALATVCFVFIFFGIFIEHLLHLAGHWLKKHRKTALYEAMQKLKTVLMQLGLMSLILTVTQRSISKICIPNKAAESMLPCRRPPQTTTTTTTKHLFISFSSPNSKFQQIIDASHHHHHQRILASAPSNSSDYCGSKGKTSFMSEESINQLNIFIFVLAALQIVYSVATMALGRAKMKRWKRWEKETQTTEYMAANDPERFRYTRQTTFGRRHMSTFASNSAHLWIKCFFRQFFNSVVKIDYFTLRHGFISAHLSTNNSFNFRKYIQRSLEDDFKAVVGISPIMWFVVVVFLLVDVHGWNVYLWVSFLPLLIVLFVGTKLEIVVAEMAMHLVNNNTVIKGTPLVQPDNNLFWFKRPQLVLTLLHFILFMNAFELSFFIWVTWQFGINSCYHENVAIFVIRVVLAVTVQVLCSYITLPLYALVTQMGSKYKSAILEEHTIHAIKRWHANVKQKRKMDSLQPNIEDDSTSPSSVAVAVAVVEARQSNSGRSTWTDGSSSHRRAPTFMEFASAGDHDHEDEIVEDVEIQLQNGNTNQNHNGHQCQQRI